MRRRRVGQTIELRKAKKEEQLLKRRNVNIYDLNEPTSPVQDTVTTPPAMSAEDIILGNFPTLIFLLKYYSFY